MSKFKNSKKDEDNLGEVTDVRQDRERDNNARLMSEERNSPGSIGGCKLYMGGLSPTVTKEDLMVELEKFGDIVGVWIARNPPGFAFVEYVKTSDAEKAVRALDGFTIGDSRLRVEFAHNGRSKSGRGDSRGRGRMRTYDTTRSTRSPQIDSTRSAYEQLASLYNPDLANAVAGGSRFPYDIPGYPPMFPFIPPDELLRNLQGQRRRSRSPRGSMSRMRSPMRRRRSRSPVNGSFSGRSRDRSPPITYNGRSAERKSNGRDYRNDYSRSRPDRSNYSPTHNFNGLRGGTRLRYNRDDDRRR